MGMGGTLLTLYEHDLRDRVEVSKMMIIVAMLKKKLMGCIISALTTVASRWAEGGFSVFLLFLATNFTCPDVTPCFPHLVVSRMGSAPPHRVVLGTKSFASNIFVCSTKTNALDVTTWLERLPLVTFPDVYSVRHRGITDD